MDREVEHQASRPRDPPENQELKGLFLALAGVVQWIEHWPVNQRVAGLILSQGTCLGCGPGP